MGITNLFSVSADQFTGANRRIAIALALTAIVSTPVRAQQYKTIPIPADEPAKRFMNAAKQCVRDPGRFSQERAQFEEYFTKVYFPAMTGTTPEELGKLGDSRYNLFKTFLWATDNEQLQTSLTNLAYAAMFNIIRPQSPPFHPAVRYNAVLTLGMLDEQYAREGANPRPPKPLPKATSVLIKIVESATADNPKLKNAFAPPVILGAVVGLDRHAQHRNQVDPAAIQAMSTALLKLVAQDQPIQDMDRNAYSWLRLRAAGALATLGSVGQNNEVHDGLLRLIAGLRSLDDRCAAAALLAKINYEGAKVDGPATANALFALARDVAAAEAKRAKEVQEAEVGLGPAIGVGRSQEYGMTEGAVQERFPRRQVLVRLIDLRAGLQKVKPVVPADAQAQVDAVLAAVEPVITAAMDSKNTVELELVQAVVTMAEAVNRAVPAPQAPAASKPEDEF
jgi:hypothetical protein